MQSVQQWEDAFSPILTGVAECLPPSLLEHGTTRQWRARDNILTCGSCVDHLYYVAEGRVQLSLLHEEGSQRLLYIAEAGHFVGEAHFFYSSINIGTFHALTPCRMVSFTRQTTMHLLKTSEEFRQSLLRGLSHKALLYGTEILHMSYGSSPERLMLLLRRLAHKGEVRMTQAEVATMLGVHKVTINRLLKSLEEAALIRTFRNKIVLAESLI